MLTVAIPLLSTSVLTRLDAGQLVEREAEMRGAGWMWLAVKVGPVVLKAAILIREAGSISETNLCEASLTDPSRWEMEYMRTCAAYTGKQVFLINVLRHTHINYIYIVIEGSEYLREDLALEGSRTFQAWNFMTMLERYVMAK